VNVPIRLPTRPRAPPATCALSHLTLREYPYRWEAFHEVEMKDFEARSVNPALVVGFKADLWACDQLTLIGPPGQRFWKTLDNPAYTLPVGCTPLTASTHERYAFGFIRYGMRGYSPCVCSDPTSR
jgi:hypothetical protein